MSNTRDFLEFFAGGGMARLGLAGDFECVFANDFDHQKARVYRDNFGESHFVEADIATLSAADLPAADLAWASSPCQDVSLAGNRQGLRAKRSGAFWLFWALLRDLSRTGRSPSVVVLENVLGLLTSNGGDDFNAVIDAFVRLGYRCGVLDIDAADFVPQSRRRLFLICAHGDCVEQYATNQNGYGHSQASLAAEDALPATLKSKWVRWHLPTPQPRYITLVDVLEQDLPANAWRTEHDCEALLEQMTPAHRDRVYVACESGQFHVGAVYRRVRNGVSRPEVRYDGLAGCLRTLKGGSSRQLLLVSEHGQVKLRGLTGREAARLMGLADDYRLPEKITAATNLAGDGVCVPLVRWLSQNLLKPLANAAMPYQQSQFRLKTPI